MLSIPGRVTELCDGVSRRDILRVGGSSMLGLSLAEILKLKDLQANESSEKAPRSSFGKAKQVILIYLQGGPSHLDLWDPKEKVPEKVQSVFKNIQTTTPGVQFTELLPNLAKVVDKTTMIRSMSYTPNGLFNHTAAIYQMLTGYTADKVSPSGQLEPPNAKDFPNVGCNIIRMKPPKVPMLPFVMMPRPLQESNVVNKGGTAGFLGRAYDPYFLFPPGDDMKMDKMDALSADDLTLRKELSSERLNRRAKLRNMVKKGMPALDKAVEKYEMDSYYQQALSLISSGRAKEAFNLKKEDAKTHEKYGKNTFSQCCLLARRLVEAGTRFVEINWPKVANSNNHSWDVHTGLTKRMKDQSAPMLDSGLSALIADLDERGMLEETLVIAVGEFGRSPQRGVSTSGNGNSNDGRDHWPYCYTAMLAGGGVKRDFIYGKSDETASAPTEKPVHPTDLLATLYHSVGIEPNTIVYNHLNQPRELVKGEVVSGILA